MFKLPISVVLLIATSSVLAGVSACQRESADKSKDEVDVGTDAKSESELSSDMKRRLDAAEQQFTRLEKRAKDAKQRMTAEGRAAQGNLERELEDAQMQVKRQIDAARAAAGKQTREAMDELDKALDDFQKKIDKYDRS